MISYCLSKIYFYQFFEYGLFISVIKKNFAIYWSFIFLIYDRYLRNALDLLYRELPKTFVNLISVINVADIKYLNRGLICTAIHSVVCPCAAFPKSFSEEIELQLLFNQYQNYTDVLVNSGRYEGREDFTVVVQPFFRNFRPPRLENGEIDLSYFAPDCFHLSTKGHGQC